MPWFFYSWGRTLVPFEWEAWWAPQTIFWRREDSIACVRSLVPCLHTLDGNEVIRLCVPPNSMCLLRRTHKLCVLRNNMCLLLSTHQLCVLCISILLLRTHQLCVLRISMCLLLRTNHLCSTQQCAPIAADILFVCTAQHVLTIVDTPFVFCTTAWPCC